MFWAAFVFLCLCNGIAVFDWIMIKHSKRVAGVMYRSNLPSALSIPWVKALIFAGQLGFLICPLMGWQYGILGVLAFMSVWIVAGFGIGYGMAALLNPIVFDKSVPSIDDRMRDLVD